mgnify:CR=1 FL=1
MSDHDDARLLQTFLADRDEPCPVCGYNLRQLQSDRCPECGRALQLRVGSVEPRLFWYLVMLLPLMCSAGVGVLFLVLVLKEGMPGHLRWMEELNIWAYMSMIFVAPPLLFARRQFCKLDLPRQRVLAMTGALFSLVLFVWLIIWID